MPALNPTKSVCLAQNIVCSNTSCPLPFVQKMYLKDGGESGVPRKSVGELIKNGKNIATKAKNKMMQLPLNAF